jgi:hypothetical protein
MALILSLEACAIEKHALRVLPGTPCCSVHISLGFEHVNHFSKYDFVEH